MSYYHAQAFHLNSTTVAEEMSKCISQVEARHRCSAHAKEQLQFEVRQTGLWMAEGRRYWYQIVRVEN